MSAVGFVHVQYRMGGGAGTGEGIEDNGILISGNFQDKLNQTMRLRRVKGRFAIKYCQHFLFCFISVASFGKRPKVCWQFTTNIIKICFPADTTFSIAGKTIDRPSSSFIYRFCLIRSIF